jgi:hypothetical protein
VIMFGCISKYGNICIYILKITRKLEKHENWSVLLGDIFRVQGRCPNKEI